MCAQLDGFLPRPTNRGREHLLDLPTRGGYGAESRTNGPPWRRMPVAVALSTGEILEKVSVATGERACHAEAIDKEEAAPRAILLSTLDCARPLSVRTSWPESGNKEHRAQVFLKRTMDLSPIPCAFTHCIVYAFPFLF